MMTNPMKLAIACWLLSNILCVGSLRAEGSCLYWMIDPFVAAPDDPGAAKEFDYAYLRVVDQEGTVITTLDNYYWDGDSLASAGTQVWSNGTTPPDSMMTGGYGTWLADIEGYASESYGFVVEAYLDGDKLVGKSPIAFYSDLLNENHISQGVATVLSGNYSPWATMVPEPTTGLLVLFGLAGLALKRSRE